MANKGRNIKRNVVKRMTKKEIYAKHGIEFTTENGGMIKCPIFGWTKPLLIDGNTKLGKGVWTFSTLPTNQEYNITLPDGKKIAVRGTCPCTCKGCYATTGRYNGKDCIAANARKTILSREYLDFVERAIIAQIEADNIKLLRIHASGDFDSVAYIEMWKRVVNACKTTLFWSYTKNPVAESAFDDCKNCNIVKSVVKGYGFNFGHCEYILRVYRELTALGKKVYICRCGIDKNQHCTNCKGCATNEYVLFVEHSTNYVAEKDLYYAELVTVINAQAQNVISA